MVQLPQHHVVSGHYWDELQAVSLLLHAAAVTVLEAVVLLAFLVAECLAAAGGGACAPVEELENRVVHQLLLLLDEIVAHGCNKLDYHYYIVHRASPNLVYLLDSDLPVAEIAVTEHH